MKADAVAARKDIDAFTDRILNARKNAAEIDALARRNPPKVGDEEAARAAAAAAAPTQTNLTGLRPQKKYLVKVDCLFRWA